MHVETCGDPKMLNPHKKLVSSLFTFTSSEYIFEYLGVIAFLS